MRRTRVAALLPILLAIPSLLCLAAEVQLVSLTTLCDNYVHDERFQAEWGFACFISGLEKTILFDAGGQECSIRANLTAAGIELSAIDAVAFSHAHADHVAGLPCLFPLPSSISVFVPSWFPADWRRMVQAQTSTAVLTSGPTEICPDAVLTGPIFGSVTEEALCVRTAAGIVLLTGCAHPGIVRMVEAAQALFPGETIALVLGGFHLLQETETMLRAIAQRLCDLGVVNVAPTHCSGDLARAVFRDVFGANYVEAGVGPALTP